MTAKFKAECNQAQDIVTLKSIVLKPLSKVPDGPFESPDRVTKQVLYLQ